MTWSTRAVWFACFLALAAPGGCSDPAGNGPAPGTQLPPPVGPAGFATEMNFYQPGVQWGADGRTIYAINRLSPSLPYGVVAIEIPSGHGRAVVTGENVSFQVLRISRDGNSLFYSSERLGTQSPTSEGFSIFRAPTTGSGTEELVRGAAHIFAISPDGRMLGWKSHTSDSTFIRDLATGATHHVAGGGYPLSISADYATLLHGATPGLNVTATGIATGQSTALQGRLEDIRWGPAGAELLFWGSEGRVLVQRGIASTREVLWTSGSSGVSYNVQSATWSPDGTQVLASVAPGCTSAPCRHQLVLINAATGASRLLFDGTAPLIGRPIFSPDARHVAVTAGGHVHVINLP